MRERALTAEDEPESAAAVELGDANLDEFAAGDLLLDGEAGQDGDAGPHRNKALDSFERRELDAGVEGRFVVLEELGDLAAERRGDAVADEVLSAELADGHAGLACEGVGAVDDESDVVLVDADGVKRVLLGAEGEDAELDGALEYLVGDAAGKGALDVDLNLRTGVAVELQAREQEVRGVLVGGEGEAAAGERAQLVDGRGSFAAQQEQALGVAAQDFAGGGEGAVAGVALEEAFAEFVFKTTDGLRDGGLGAVQANGGAGEAALFNDGEEGF